MTSMSPCWVATSKFGRLVDQIMNVIVLLFIWICHPTWEYLQKLNTANSCNLPPLNGKQFGMPEILVELSKSIEVTNPDVIFKGNA